MALRENECRSLKLSQAKGQFQMYSSGANIWVAMMVRANVLPFPFLISD